MRYLKAAVLGMGRMTVLLAFTPVIALFVVLDAGGMPGPLQRLCDTVFWPILGLARPWEEQDGDEPTSLARRATKAKGMRRQG